MNERFLLDTCAVIWIANFEPVSREAALALSRSGDRQQLVSLSAMSAWEIGMLISKGRLATTKTALSWFTGFAERIGAEVLPVSPSVLVAASFLPLPVHNDPVDRILIATAREYGLTIITRDRAILAYGAAGNVNTLAC
jgi:PIN domain nuclease of toxin-antitoxin system